MYRFVPLALLGALTFSTVATAVPPNFTHQGRLVDSAGAPLDGTHSLTFSIYGAPAGGAALWSETHSLAFDNGFFSAHLGTLNPLDARDFGDDDTLFLSISVDGGPPLPKRLELSSVPFALWSNTSTNVRGGEVDASVIKINGTTVIDSTGKPAVKWGDITGMPAGFADGRDDVGDTLPTCGDGELLVSNSSGAWGCAAASELTLSFDDIEGTIAEDQIPFGLGNDHVARGDHGHNGIEGLDCSNGEVPKYNGSANKWECASGGAGGTGALLFSFELDESGGTSFADTSGGGNDATNPAGGLAAGSAGHSNRGVNFSGGVITVPTGNVIQDSPYVTVEAWVEPGLPLTGKRVIVMKEGGWKLTQSDDRVEFTITAANGACTATSVAKVTAGAWAHVQGSYNGRYVEVMVNDARIRAACAKGPIEGTVGDKLHIGANATTGVTEPYKGIIDEVRGWSQPQTPFGGGRDLYYQWGASACTKGTQIYAGWVFNEYHGHSGSADNLCLEKGKATGDAEPYGSGDLLYPSSIDGGNVHSGNITNSKRMHCAACVSDYGSCFVRMGATTCPAGWDAMYTGAVYGSHYTHAAPYDRICVDNQTFNNSVANSPNSGAHMYPTRVHSNPATDIPTGRRVTCAVCCGG